MLYYYYYYYNKAANLAVRTKWQTGYRSRVLNPLLNQITSCR
jgi:hypothetical protein